MGSLNLLTFIALSVSANAALAASMPLVNCKIGDFVHNISLVQPGIISFEGVQTALLSASVQSPEPGKISYDLKTANGHSISLVQTQSNGTLDFWDMGEHEGKCESDTLNAVEFDALAQQSAELYKAKWKLADCEQDKDPTNRFIVVFRAGFAPGLVLVHGENLKQPGFVEYAFLGPGRVGAHGQFQTDYSAEGGLHYFVEGQHFIGLNSFSIVNFTRLFPNLPQAILTGEVSLDKSLGACSITNQWHLEKLLNVK